MEGCIGGVERYEELGGVECFNRQIKNVSREMVGSGRGGVGWGGVGVDSSNLLFDSII